jgi:hypothetical protein
MNRREMLTLSSSALAAAIACSKVSSPTSPELPPQKPQAPSPASSSVVIDTRKVGERKFSVTSPATGNLYYDVLPQITSLVIGTRRYDRDRVSGTQLNGFAVVVVNGDLGPELRSRRKSQRWLGDWNRKSTRLLRFDHGCSRGQE